MSTKEKENTKKERPGIFKLLFQSIRKFDNSFLGIYAAYLLNKESSPSRSIGLASLSGFMLLFITVSIIIGVLTFLDSQVFPAFSPVALFVIVSILQIMIILMAEKNESKEI